MVFTVFMFIPRKPGMTLEAFKEHYETKHVPLCLAALGDEKPIRHSRYYLQRNASAGAPQLASANSDDPPPPLLYLGDPATVDYDCISVVEYEDEAHFLRFKEVMQNGPDREKIMADQDAFEDHARMKAVAVESPKVSER
ncbi:Nn.00g084740.m01.CDS01 [Neocucurbitaria sp. VM-36]